jgi:hypothetical protein
MNYLALKVKSPGGRRRELADANSQTRSRFRTRPKVFRTVKAGNFRLSEAQRRDLVVRAAPLKELKSIVKCTGIDKSYFVVTGVVGWHSVR